MARKKRRLVLALGLLVVFRGAEVSAGLLSSSVARYRLEVAALADGETNPDAHRYLQARLAEAARLDGMEAGDPRAPEALRQLKEARLAADGELGPGTSGLPSVRAETAAYNQYLQPFLKEGYVNRVSLQQQLLERKYFGPDPAKKANFVEGWLNGRLPFTRSDLSVQGLERSDLGVSPFEVIFRLEPALAFYEGERAAVLGALGISHAFFPDVKPSEGRLTLEQGFLSEWVRKAGLRLGVGATHVYDEARLLLGAGAQIRAVALWWLYDPEDRAGMLAVGTSDLSAAKKVFGWFE